MRESNESLGLVLNNKELFRFGSFNSWFRLVLPFSGPGNSALHVENELDFETEDVLVIPGPLLEVSVREEMRKSHLVASSN